MSFNAQAFARKSVMTDRFYKILTGNFMPANDLKCTLVP